MYFSHNGNVKFSLDVSKFESVIGVDATSAALVPKTNPAKCCWTRDLYVGNRRGKTQGWITQPKQWDIHLKVCIGNHLPTLICSQQSFKDKKEQGCTYPSLPDVVGRRLNLFQLTSLSPGDSRAPGPILPPLRSSWNSAVSWAAQKVSKHLIKKYMCNFCLCS